MSAAPFQDRSLAAGSDPYSIGLMTTVNKQCDAAETELAALTPQPPAGQASAIVDAIESVRTVAFNALSGLSTATVALNYYATASNYVTAPPNTPIAADKGQTAQTALNNINGA